MIESSMIEAAAWLLLISGVGVFLLVGGIIAALVQRMKK